MTFIGPDGKQYVAIYAGIGGWMGASRLPTVSTDDPYAALGAVGAMKKIKQMTQPGERSMSSAIRKLLRSQFYFCWALTGLAATSELRVAPTRIICLTPTSNSRVLKTHLRELIAKDLGMDVSYFWFPQRAQVFSNTLQSGACDVVMGVPAGIDVASTTIPYYRSTYVFVSRRDRDLAHPFFR